MELNILFFEACHTQEQEETYVKFFCHCEARLFSQMFVSNDLLGAKEKNLYLEQKFLQYLADPYQFFLEFCQAR